MVSNSPIERTSSFRLSSRPCASGLLSFCHIVRIAGFIEDDLGEFGMRKAGQRLAPAREGCEQVAQRVARLGRQVRRSGSRASAAR